MEFFRSPPLAVPQRFATFCNGFQNVVSWEKQRRASGIARALGQNVLRLNSQTNFDWDIFKNFHFSERVNLQLRGECYNIFNLHAFQQVASANNGPVITSPSFGQYTAVSLNARTIQIGARVVF